MTKIEPLFPTIFRKLQGHDVIVELKNNLILKGHLVSTNQNMNIKLAEVTVLTAALFPHLPSISSVFIRGSSIRYIHLPIEEFDLGEAHHLTQVHNAQFKASLSQ